LIPDPSATNLPPRRVASPREPEEVVADRSFAAHMGAIFLLLVAAAGFGVLVSVCLTGGAS
jgi:hypothetical protein